MPSGMRFRHLQLFAALELDALKTKELTSKGVMVKFHKEGLTFNGEDRPMSNLLLSMLGAVAEFERSIILERQREGIAIAKAAEKYKGRKPALSPDGVKELVLSAAAGEKKSALARYHRVSSKTVYAYLGSVPSSIWLISVLLANDLSTSEGKS